jgi:hypothetical protein
LKWREEEREGGPPWPQLAYESNYNKVVAVYNNLNIIYICLVGMERRERECKSQL